MSPVCITVNLYFTIARKSTENLSWRLRVRFLDLLPPQPNNEQVVCQPWRVEGAILSASRCKDKANGWPLMTCLQLGRPFYTYGVGRHLGFWGCDPIFNGDLSCAYMNTHTKMEDSSSRIFQVIQLRWWTRRMYRLFSSPLLALGQGTISRRSCLKSSYGQ